MRALVAVCLLGACAGGPRTTAGDQIVELPGEAWHVTYRLVLDDSAAPRLEGWARVTNSSSVDWSDATMTLATRERRVDDLDADGRRDRDDLCPSDREDLDGYNDDDGCPDADNDSDRIIDASDTCPNEPETYNGLDDNDGCPDRAPVVVTQHHGGIVESVFFTSNSDVVKTVSLPIVDAVAATIEGNPQLRLVEITGHTDRTERDPWSLSVRRAAAVSKRLVDQGVAPERLALTPYAATQPMSTGTSAADLARSRRVGFTVAARDDDSPVVQAPLARPPFDPPRAEPVDDLRYKLAQPITLKRGATAEIAILDKPITAQAIAMYQPSSDVADSYKHPFHAVRLVNTTSFVLQRGPLEVLQGGRVVARGELRRTGIGDVARIQGELDRDTTVAASSTVTVEPRQIHGISNGELAVDDAAIETTTYTVTARTALTIELHHRRVPGQATDRTVETREVLPGAPSAVTVVESWPRPGRRPIASLSAKQLADYVERSTLPADVTDRLRAVGASILAIEGHQRTALTQRTKLADVAARWHRSQRPLDRATRTELEELARVIGQTTELLAREQTRLGELVRDLQL